MQGNNTALQPSYRGKVRDVYDLGEQLIVVASDRISAYDVVFDQLIAGKGQILTRIAAHWFKILKDVPHHLVSTEIESFPAPYKEMAEKWQDRAMLVKKAERVDFECVVRGYLMGSGFKAYESEGEIFGNKLPPGLTMGSQLPQPIFTPATKSERGDENVSFEFMQQKIGSELAEQLRALSLKLYGWASDKLKEQGLLLLDTKFEFGRLGNDIILIDEVFTPDSSRYTTVKAYEEALQKGAAPPSIDKQVIRDYVSSSGWNKKPPAPHLPENIIEEAINRYKLIEEKVLCIS